MMATENSNSVKVYFGNLPFSLSEDTLTNFASASGVVVSAEIMKFGKRSKGFGFVTFSNVNEAAKAVEELHENELLGRVIQVRHSKPKEENKRPATAKGTRTPVVKEKRIDLEVKQVPEKTETSDNLKQKLRRKKETKISKDNNSPVEKSEETSNQPDSGRKPKIVNRIDTTLNTSMYVANLPFKVRDADLFSIFKDYAVKNAYVVKRFGRSRGFGFVEFETTEERDKVLNEVFNAIVNDRVIVMKPAMANPTSQEETAVNDA